MKMMIDAIGNAFSYLIPKRFCDCSRVSSGISIRVSFLGDSNVLVVEQPCSLAAI